jgi:putative thioredoxin
MEQALEARGQGDAAHALELMEQAYRDDPDNPRLPLELVRLLIEDGQLDRADEVLDKLPLAMAEQPGSKGMRTLIEFSRATRDAPPVEALLTSLDTDPADSRARYQLAARQVLATDYEGALENLFELLKRDRKFGDGTAQRGLLAVFDLLGENDERVTTYRRRMFALLH